MKKKQQQQQRLEREKMAKTEKDEKAKDRELKTELLDLIKEIWADQDGIATYDRGTEIFLSLQQLKFKKSSSSVVEEERKKEFGSDGGGGGDVPKEFRCPISNELMVDPVVVASGQTYDRRYIEGYLSSSCRICPSSRQVLSHTNLIPNELVREMTLQWCNKQGIELPNPTEELGISKKERQNFDSLIQKVVSESISERKEAAKALRQLTKSISSYRSRFKENPELITKLLFPLAYGLADGKPDLQANLKEEFDGLKKTMASYESLFDDNNAITQLVVPLTNGKIDSHPDLQEDLITTLLNLSIHDDNKKLVGQNPLAIPLLIESLGKGNIATKTNAAGALFTLAALDSNKAIIGNYGAIKPLIQLLEEGHALAMKDVCLAIFQLCLNHENKAIAVKEGAVSVVMKKIIANVLVDEMVATLALLSIHQKGIDELCVQGAVPYLLKIIREGTCDRTKENCISILYNICVNDRSRLREVREEEAANGTISNLAVDDNSRSRRKAEGVLKKVNKSNFPPHTC